MLHGSLRESLRQRQVTLSRLDLEVKVQLYPPDRSVADCKSNNGLNASILG